MLDAFIIEQIRQRDEETRRILERPSLQMPMPVTDEEVEREEETTEPPRVIVIDL